MLCYQYKILFNQMSAKHKRRPKSKQPEQTSSQKDSVIPEEQINPQNHDININDSPGIQISSAQAEIYFEYLRKKITHHVNDPFSLPFLKLKFQQLESWKGATEQLNLESRVYGMKVDNCHDYTVKMLNYVIRNQEQEISRPQAKNNSSSVAINPDDYKTNQNQSQSQKNYNFHLQKAQKLICNIQVDKNLANRSLWKAIFKKIETLQKIQLNTLQISDNLALQIDQKNLQWSKKYFDDQQYNGNHQYLKQDQNNHKFLEDFLSFNRFSTDKLRIFQEISGVKNDISQQIQEILQFKSDRQNNRKYEPSIQQPLHQNYFGYQQIDFDGIYQEFNQFIRYQQNAKINENSQKTNFDFQQEENRQEVFVPLQRDLYSLPIDHINMMNSQVQQFQHQQSDDDIQDQLQGDLYEPHKDILFHSTLKKAKASKRNQVKNYGKRKKDNKTLIDFYDPSVVINRKNIFKQRKQVKNNIQNDNLVPINYVVLYQSRNPFKKPKKVFKHSNRISFYENFQSLPLMDFNHQNGRGRQSLQKINVSQTLDVPFQFDRQNNQQNHQQRQFFQGQIVFGQTHYRNVSMKTVKNEIKKEMSYIEQNSMKLTNQKTRQSYFSFNNQTSAMDSFLQEEGRRIGLKLLKQKMTNYDPLDILMSMLHVAYENQVLLQPVYISSSEDKGVNIFELQDIIIQGEF